MDPFTITVGALGITEFAMSSIEKLHKFINSLAEAKEVVQDIAANLEAVQRPLAALAELKISNNATYNEAKKDLEKTGVAEAVNGCGQACAEFTKKLEQWTKHSSSTKLSIRDRLSVGVWNKEKIHTFRTRVQSCQAVVQFAVTSTQLIVQLRSDHNSNTDREELKKQMQSLEKAIQDHVDLTKKQQKDAENRKEELQKEPAYEEDDGAQRTLAIKEVEEQSRLLAADEAASKVVSSQVRSRLPEQAAGQEISNTVTFGDQNSGFQVGVSNGPISGISFGGK